MDNRWEPSDEHTPCLTCSRVATYPGIPVACVRSLPIFLLKVIACRGGANFNEASMARVEQPCWAPHKAQVKTLEFGFLKARMIPHDCPVQTAGADEVIVLGCCPEC